MGIELNRHVYNLICIMHERRYSVYSSFRVYVLSVVVLVVLIVSDIRREKAILLKFFNIHSNSSYFFKKKEEGENTRTQELSEFVFFFAVGDGRFDTGFFSLFNFSSAFYILFQKRYGKPIEKENFPININCYYSKTL